MVQTPVGARCPDCARLQRLPTFEVDRRYYLRAIATAIGLAFALGAAWWAIRAVMGIPYFNFLLAAGFGWVIGELVGRSVNRKRGRGLAFIAGTGVVLSFTISVFPPWGLWIARFSALGLAISLIAVALGVWIAVTRVR
jgi:hypothetical protein